MIKYLLSIFHKIFGHTDPLDDLDTLYDEITTDEEKHMSIWRTTFKPLGDSIDN